jgi:hypothetical protein
VLTVLGPYATTGFKYRGIVGRDRSTAREFTDKGVPVAPLQRREDGRVFYAPALDHSYRCGERDDHDSADPHKLLRSEIGAHQWNIRTVVGW